MLVSGQSKEAVADECREMGWGRFKPLLSDAMVAALAPIQEKYAAIRADEGYLESVLRDGQEKAGAIAQETLTKVKRAMGYTMAG